MPSCASVIFSLPCLTAFLTGNKSFVVAGWSLNLSPQTSGNAVPQDVRLQTADSPNLQLAVQPCKSITNKHGNWPRLSGTSVNVNFTYFAGLTLGLVKFYANGSLETKPPLLPRAGVAGVTKLSPGISPRQGSNSRLAFCRDDLLAPKPCQPVPRPGLFFSSSAHPLIHAHHAHHAHQTHQAPSPEPPFFVSTAEPGPLACLQGATNPILPISHGLVSRLGFAAWFRNLLLVPCHLSLPSCQGLRGPFF